MEPNQDIVLELAENESRISVLYGVFSQIYPEMQAFWSEISGDETKHQQILLRLSEEERTGQVHVDRDRFHPEAVKFVRDYLDEKIAQANRSDKPSLTEALVIAEYIENSLLEKEFFKIFDSDSVDIKNALNSLEKDTEEHLREVQEKIKDYTHGPISRV
jgi:hypothetical protein